MDGDGVDVTVEQNLASGTASVYCNYYVPSVIMDFLEVHFTVESFELGDDEFSDGLFFPWWIPTGDSDEIPQKGSKLAHGRHTQSPTMLDILLASPLDS